MQLFSTVKNYYMKVAFKVKNEMRTLGIYIEKSILKWKQTILNLYIKKCNGFENRYYTSETSFETTKGRKTFKKLNCGNYLKAVSKIDKKQVKLFSTNLFRSENS